MEGKITIVNTVNAEVGIKLPDIHFSHTWMKKGDKFSVNPEIFDAMMYDTGARNIFEKGILYTEDMGIKKEYGLEPEEAEEPVNIIILPENQMERYLKVMPYHEFKTNLDKMSNDQVVHLAQFAIENEILTQVEKIEYITKRTGINVYNAIEEKRKDKKEV
jgi:hypothetical protein